MRQRCARRWRRCRTIAKTHARRSKRPLSHERSVGGVCGREPDLALVELTAELREPVFGEVAGRETEGGSEELERTAAELPAGGEVGYVALAKPASGPIERLRLGGESPVGDRVFAHQRWQRLCEWGREEQRNEKCR